MTARLVGIRTTAAGRTLRQKWWDQVLLPAYRITSIPEIRNRAWRSELGATGAEREETWNSLTTYAANEHLDSLQAQVIEAAEIYEIELTVVTSALYDGAGMPFDSLAQARSNMRFFTELDTSLEEESAFSEDPSSTEGPSSTYLSLPTVEPPPPCDDDDALESAQTPPDRCITASSVATEITHWTTATTPFFDDRACLYKVPVETPYSCPNGEDLIDYVEEFAPQAIASLMEFLQKAYTEEDASIISEYIVSQEAYEFDIIVGPNLRLLYNVPFGLIRALRLSSLTPALFSDSDVEGSTFTVETENLMHDLDVLDEYLGIFGSQQAQFVREQQTKIVIAGTLTEISFNGEAAQVGKLKKSLLDVLLAGGYILPSEGSISQSQVSFPAERKVAAKIKIVYDSGLRIQALFAQEEGDQEVEISLQTLEANVGLRSPTMLNYLVKIGPIVSAVNRTNRIGLLDFAESYHFPPVGTSSPTANNTLSSGDSVAQNINAEIASVVMEGLMSAADAFTDKFSQYSCMDPKQLKGRDAEIEASAAELRQIVIDARNSIVQSADRVFDNAVESVQNVVADAAGLAAAWEKLFNKMSACGLAKLLMQAMDFISDATCGVIDPQEALKQAIASILKNVEAQVLQEINSKIPPELSGIIRAAYTADVGALVQEVGYNRGNQFPWEFEEAVAEQGAREERGQVFYAESLFTVPNRAEILARQQAAFTAGFDADFGSFGDDLLSQAGDAFWNGFVGARRSDAPPRAEASYEPPINLPEISSPADVSNLGQQLGTGMIENYVNAVMDNLSFDQLVSITEDIPVVGVLLSQLSTSVKCAVNVNISSGEQSKKEPSVQPQQNNLSQGGPFDICNLTGGPAPITMPDMELAMKQNVNTLWAAFQNALIDALMVLLRTLLMRALTALMKVVSEVLSGTLCDLVRTVASEIQNQHGEEVPTRGDLRGLLGSALAGDDGDANDELNRAFSALGGLSLEDSALLTAGENNIVDMLTPRLRADQLLNLLQGNATNSTLDTVLDVIARNPSSLSETLTDRATVRSFFSAMGTVFPQGFLSQQRQALEDFGGTREIIATLCGSDPNQALDDLADRLRDQCGDAITEEQIQNQLDSFQQRIGDTIDALTKPLAQGGMDNVLQDSFQKVIQETVPKDEPGNLTIAEDIIAGMFNPMYVFYTKDLMKPMQPNRNAGFLNLVLANKNGVPQRGQIANYNAAKAFATTLLSGFFPFAREAISEDVSEGLEEKFFGSGGLSLKPPTVASYLENQLETLDIVIDENSISMGFVPPIPLMTTDAFVINYNFDDGRFDLTYPVPFPGRLPLQTVGGTGIATYEDLLNNGTIVNNIRDEVTSFTDPTATNMGAGLMVYSGHLFTPTLAAPLSGPSDDEFADAVVLVNRMRVALLQSQARNLMLRNDRAFKYGNYSLADLTDDMFLSTGDGIPLTPAPNGYVLQRVENATPDVNDDSYIVTPPPKGGWLEFKDNLLPQTSDDFCCPTKKELFDVESIIEGAMKSFENANDDPRLSFNPRKVEEPPYNKILTRMNLASIEGTIVATLRTYIIEYFLKGAVSFTKFKTNIPDVYGNILAAYIAQKVRDGLRASGPFPGAPTYPPVVPPMPIPGNPDGNLLYAYWYEFLEQCAQVVSRRVKDGAIEVNAELDQAMRKLQSVVENYAYPQRSDLIAARVAAAALGADPIAQPSITLKSLRLKTKVDAIRDSEDAAMVVLKYLIVDEYKRISDYVEQVFREPRGGWVADLDEEFLNKGTYRLGEIGNIFDVPGAESDLFRGAIRFNTAEQEKFSQGQYVLQSYVRFNRNAEGVEIFRDLEDDQIYGIYELATLFATILGIATPGSPAETIRTAPIDTYFESFKYGLRMVYVPSSEDISALDAAGSTSYDGLRGMGGSYRATAGRMFGHSPIVGSSLGAYSFPVVYSEDLELDYASSIDTFIGEADSMRPAVGLLAVNDSRASIGNFNWELLSFLLRSSEEFRLMFRYTIPMTDMVSVLTIFAAEAFLPSIGGISDTWLLAPPTPAVPPHFPAGTGFPPRLAPAPAPPNNYYMWSRRAFPLLRRKLKKLFRELYNSNDFTYRSEPRNRRAREEVNRTREETSVGFPTSGLSPELANNVIVQLPGWDCGEQTSEGVRPEDVVPDDARSTLSEYVCATWTWTYRSSRAGGTASETLYQIIPSARDGSGQTLPDLLDGTYFGRAPGLYGPSDPGGPAGDISYINAPGATEPSEISATNICEEYEGAVYSPETPRDERVGESSGTSRRSTSGRTGGGGYS